MGRVLEDEEKPRQANAKRAILLYVARNGMGRTRTQPIWAQGLAMLLPDTTPFVGGGSPFQMSALRRL